MLPTRNKNTENLVSIIMPAYNSEKFIGAALDSVIVQTYRNWEVIVIDDCSTDRTSEVIKEKMDRDSRIRYYRLPINSGAAIARNTALEMAQGRYMAFLDSDDLWLPDKLARQIEFMQRNSYTFTCTSYTKIDEQGNSLNRIIRVQHRRDYYGVLKTCPGNSTVIYDAMELGKHKIPNLRKRNDYVMWLKIIKKAKFLYGLEEPLGSHRVRNDSISSNKISLVAYHWEIFRNIEHLSLLRSSYLIIYWVVATVFRLR